MKKVRDLLDKAAKKGTPILQIGVMENGVYGVRVDREVIFMNGDKDVWLVPEGTSFLIREGQSLLIDLPQSHSEIKPLCTVEEFNVITQEAKKDVETQLLERADPTKEC